MVSKKSRQEVRVKKHRRMRNQGLVFRYSEAIIICMLKLSTIPPE